MDKDKIDISVKNCRACLDISKELINIFDMKSKDVNSISNKILECTTVKVKEADNLPMNICKNCLNKLNTAYDFKIMFLQSDEKLRQILNSENSRLISKTHHTLGSTCKNNDETIDHKENMRIQSEVINTEMDIKEENEDCFDGNNTTGNICDDIDDLSDNCDTEEVVIKNSEKTEDATVDDIESKNVIVEEIGHLGEIEDATEDVNDLIDSAIKSMDTADYEKLKNSNLSYSEKKRLMLKCKQCDRSYRYHYFFNIHLPTHTGQVPHKCEICGKSYAKSYILKKHMLNHDNTRERFTCEECGLTFKYRGGLQTHRKLIHIEADGFPHKCHICEKMFRHINQLNIHIRRHTGEKPFVCDICGKAFTDQSGLYNHRPIHNVVNEFSCTKCGKSFKTKKSLGSHMSRHSELKPYVCSYCNKRFNSRGVLNNHVAIHTGAKPYACKVCGKRFRQHGCISRHMRIHTGETPYVCEICPAGFKYSHHLLKHMKSHDSNLSE